MPEADGTDQFIGYGSSPRITRLDGTGNGGRELELTAESENEIVASGFMQNPTYEYGSGPINIKVVDPLNLADGYFECLFDEVSVGMKAGLARKTCPRKIKCVYKLKIVMLI